jgi:hypothetical protein
MLRRRWHWRTLLGLRGELFTVERDKPRETLTHGERRTIQSNLLVALVTVGAGLLSASVIYLQFGEMAKQTKLLTDQQKQAQEDSKAAAKVTEEQLALTRNSVAALQAQAKAAQQQAGEAQLQMETSQHQLELSERPWVTIEGQFREPTWVLGNQWVGRQDGTQVPYMRLDFQFDYQFTNSGLTPATRTFAVMMAEHTENGKNFTRPIALMNQACSIAESERKEAQNPKYSGSSLGSVVFPHANPITRTWIPNVGFAADQPELLRGAWVAACIVYQAGFSPHVYHTKLWYLSKSRPGIVSQAPIQPGSPFMWYPWDNFVLFDSEAD